MKSERLTGGFYFRNSYFGQILMLETEVVEHLTYYTKRSIRYRKATKEEAELLFKQLTK